MMNIRAMTDKTANNTTLQVTARIVWIIFPFVFSALCYMYWNYLSDKFETQAAATATVSKNLDLTNTKLNDFITVTTAGQSVRDSRLTGLEANQTSSNKAIEDFKRDVLNRVDKLSDKVDKQTNAVTDLAATIRERDRASGVTSPN